jgi:hypothetical protein
VKTVYTRKLSSEDAGTGTILIEKARWKHFPPPMREFAVSVGGKRFATRIVAEDCECVLPRHQHYHLEAGHFRDRLDFAKGAMVQITLDGGQYTIANG